MNARDFLDNLKREFNLKNDNELAEKLEVKQTTLSKWIVRNKIPEKIFNNMRQKVSTETQENIIKVKKLSSKVQAGYNLTEIDSVEQIGELILDISIFKTPPPKKIFAMQVEGYSMIPMIFPDSWVVFDDSKIFKGDGLYIINWDGSLMVKLVQATPRNGTVKIISSNKDYESWEIDLNDNQCSFNIFGKVLKTII